MLKEMEHLSPRLKKLRIIRISTHGQLQATFRCPSIVLDHLHSLSLDFSIGNVVLQNLGPMSQLRGLRKLELRGTIEDKSKRILFPHNLEELKLQFTRLESHGTMDAIGRLAQLKALILSDCAYMGYEWTCTTNMFLHLEELLIGFPNLMEWRLENGAMSFLKTLKVIGCDKLESLPTKLEFITALQEPHIEKEKRAKRRRC